MNSSNEDPIFGKVISTYTTREAVADGFLIELLPTVSTELRDAGIRVPAYLTTGVWEKYVEVP
jgi:type I site-specific restriction endonuclease